jgi:hypothetical protein
MKKETSRRLAAGDNDIKETHAHVQKDATVTLLQVGAKLDQHMIVQNELQALYLVTKQMITTEAQGEEV